jgi:HEAT repeat protein
MPKESKKPKRVLEQLAEQGDAVPFSQLYALSDLSGEDLVEFRTAWTELPADHRRRLIRALVELAEASFQVSFDAIFRFCLEDNEDYVRARAIEGLWEDERVALVGPLVTMLRHDPSPDVRSAAAKGLGRFVLGGELERIEPPIQARIITDLLTTFYLAGESIEVRRRAVESVAYACTSDVLAALEVAYYEEDERMRLSALVGMGRTCDPRWESILLDELGNRSPAMRYEAALASGELSLKSAVSSLERLLDDADNQVRDASIWALGQIGGARAREALLSAYDHADENTRSAIEDALAEQALAEGDLDFLLYEIEEEQNDTLGDAHLVLWSAEDESNGEPYEDDEDLI